MIVVTSRRKEHDCCRPVLIARWHDCCKLVLNSSLTWLLQTFVKGYLISFVRLLLGIDAQEKSGHLSSVCIRQWPFWFCCLCHSLSIVSDAVDTCTECGQFVCFCVCVCVGGGLTIHLYIYSFLYLFILSVWGWGHSIVKYLVPDVKPPLSSDHIFRNSPFIII